MSSVATTPAARPAPPPVRHGISRWSVWIQPTGQTGGHRYSVRPLPDQPGFRGVWQVRKHGSPTTYTVAAPKQGDPGCTCPDHESRGSVCKHILALAALGLFRRPKAARPKKAPSQARALRAHAKTAREAIAEARTLGAQARAHLAEIAAPAPAGPRPIDELMTAPQPGTAVLYPVPAGYPDPADFAAGFRTAIQDHLARRRAYDSAPWPVAEEVES